MSRTHAESHDRVRPLDVGALTYSADEDAWVGSVGDVLAYLPGTPRGGVPVEISALADSVLGQLQRFIGLVRDELVDAVDQTVRSDWQCVDVRFYDNDPRRSFSLTFVLSSEEGAEWDAVFVGQKLSSVRRKIALW